MAIKRSCLPIGAAVHATSIRERPGHCIIHPLNKTPASQGHTGGCVFLILSLWRKDFRLIYGRGEGFKPDVEIIITYFTTGNKLDFHITVISRVRRAWSRKEKITISEVKGQSMGTDWMEGRKATGCQTAIGSNNLQDDICEGSHSTVQARCP